MKKLTTSLSAFLIIFSLFASEEINFIEDYIARKIEVDYPYPRTTVHEYYIFAAQEDTPQQLIELIKDPSQKTHWRKAIHALGVLSVGDDYDIPLEALTQIAEDWESNSVLSDKERLRFLERAYWGIAYQGSIESLEFLKQRAQSDFWEGRELPEGTYHISHSGRPAVTISARWEAIGAIGSHPLEAAEEYLQELYKKPEFYEDDVLREKLESQFRMRSTWLNGHQKRIRAFEAKRELEGQSNEPAVEITTTSPEVVEKIVAPEPVIEEEPTEVVVAEPIEENVVQSSNWWLWLIGLLVVVGGLGLVVRRKS